MTNEEFQKFIIENMATKTDMEEIRQSLTRIENGRGFFEKANQEGFSAFYSSPVLPILVREVYKRAAQKESSKTGFTGSGKRISFTKHNRPDRFLKPVRSMIGGNHVKNKSSVL